MKKKWLGIPVVAIIAVLLVAAVGASAALLAIGSQHVTQVITERVSPPQPSGSITSPSPITLPSMETGTEFSVLQSLPVTVYTNTAPVTLAIHVIAGNYVEFGVKLVCTSANSASASPSSIEVSTYQDLDGSITLNAAGTYTFSETIVGYTGAVGTGSGDIQYQLTNP